MGEKLTPDQLAERWGKSPGTLQNWRSQGKGPPYTKIGKTITYDLDDVIQFEAEHKIMPEQSNG